MAEQEQEQTDGLVPIPSPPGLPLLGHVAAFDPENPLGTMVNFSKSYGEIFRLYFPGRSVVIVSSQRLINETCNEKNFQKTLKTVLRHIRSGVHDGLFTATNEEPNWGLAHRILMPAFGPASIRGMFDEMFDIASQLVLKWARYGSSNPIHASSDFTRLALDTLALCAMDFRFNSYYRDEMHPFVAAMGDFLTTSGTKNRRPPFLNFMYRDIDKKYEADIELLRRTANEVLQFRKENPNDRKDLLTAMVKGVDVRTGQKLSDDSIIDNLITFLIAGHETTSGLLSFTFYELLKHPEKFRKAQEEVDTVIGRDKIRVEHLTKLPYMAAILREVLRLDSPIPAFAVEAKEDVVLGGKYKIEKGQPVMNLLAKAHLDTSVWGPDAEEFKPERMLDGNFDRIQKEFPNCWKPFGNGMRACIGRPFAWQEALLAMALLLQNFNFVMHDPNYTLQLAETLTIKPKGFYIRAIPRHGMSALDLERYLTGGMGGTNASCTHESAPKTNGAAAKHSQEGGGGKPMSIFFGSNSGTCEAMAHRLATDAAANGFRPLLVDALDVAKENLPKDHPVVIITASYEGQPPDNAAHFVSWIENLKGKEMEGVSYVVYACGHRDWSQTFHRIPKLVDSTLQRLGATQILPMGSTDAADRDMFSDFETWEDTELWPALRKRYETAEVNEGVLSRSALSVDISYPRSSTLRHDVQQARVVEASGLTEGDSPKRHLEIKLPTGMTYRAGDYLAVLPMNPLDSVKRAMRKFHLGWDSYISLSGNVPSHFPREKTLPVVEILGAYVELSQPATKRNILAMAEATSDAETIKKLEQLAGEDYQTLVSTKRSSIVDILDEFPLVELPFGSFLGMLPPMRVRQYSISSSPLWNQENVTLTYSVLDKPSLSGKGRYVGVATHFLSTLREGDQIHVAVRPSHAAFHLPSDSENTPIICVAAGSGLAPFRGFIQERAALIGAGRKLAPALLFLGCRQPGEEDLYAEELAGWEKAGAVDVRRAYSRAPEKSEGCKYVQDRLLHDSEDVLDLWRQGAKFFVCGSRAVGKGVDSVCIKLMLQEMKKAGCKNATEEDAKAKFEALRNERYATDVFD